MAVYYVKKDGQVRIVISFNVLIIVKTVANVW